MISRLREYRQRHGHTLISKQEDEELHLWAQSIRKNYRNKKAVIGQLDNSTTTATTTHQHDDDDVSHWQMEAPMLPVERLQQLKEVDFVWDVQGALWDQRYKELQQFEKLHGHCLVPANYPVLGVWVRNQRREYRNLERGERSTLTQERLQKLHALSFYFPRSRMESWENRYQELLEYYREHGDSDVPEDWAGGNHGSRLGQWCMNQRTLYRRHLRGEATSLTEERIRLLEDVQFAWNLFDKRWYAKLERVKEFFLQHGHVNIPVDSSGRDRDLRVWLALQRYYYRARKRNMKTQGRNQTDDASSASSSSFPISVPLTEERIAAIEQAIPNFPWKLRDSAGPSREDWADLFQAMRDKGLRPDVRPKQHWFEGQERFVTIKDVWTEDDLMELWNTEDEEEEEEEVASDSGFGF